MELTIDEKNLVSVIIPVYNTARYLNECFESVVNQTYKNLEILIIDDGSSDDSSKTCDLWAEKDFRVKVFHKENEGLGLTRNFGLKNASGEYLIFVDSDDYIKKELIEKSLELIKSEKCEVVCYGFVITDEDGNEISHRRPQSRKKTWINQEIKNVFLKDALVENGGNDLKNIQMSLCSMMFDLGFIKKIKWESESERKLISEDVYSLLELFQHVNRVSVLKEALYYYRMRNTSLTHTYHDNRFEENMKCYRECRKLAERCNYPKAVTIRISDQAFSNVISMIKAMAYDNLSQSEYNKRLKIMRDNKYFRNILKEKLSYRDKIQRKILVWCLYFRLWKVVRIIVEAKMKYG